MLNNRLGMQGGGEDKEFISRMIESPWVKPELHFLTMQSGCVTSPFFCK